MSELPLEEISVAALARRCKVNRQTFYYHFHDIYDLLTLVFLDEKIEGIDDNYLAQDIRADYLQMYDDYFNTIELPQFELFKAEQPENN